MRKFALTAILGLAAGTMLCRSNPVPIYAASHPQAATQAQSNAAGQPPTHGEGAELYENNCAICHGEKMEGILPAFPPLVGIQRQLTNEQITDLVHHGKGRMPAFTKLTDDDMTALLHFLNSSQTMVATTAGALAGMSAGRSKLAEAGSSLFQQNCAFCHGREAEGGETGPDLTRSKLVAADHNGDKITEVVRDGRPQKNMPHFTFSDQELAGLVAFIHEERAKANSRPGGRRGVDVSDLQTGNAAQGKRYFEANCASCHSPTGDLAGIASRFEGLELERRMLYPEDAKSKVTVTLPGGKKVSGTLAYLDEFTVGLRDDSGTYRSWSIPNVKYTVDAPVEAHVQLFSKYTDADIHNLMAFIQTLH